MKPGRNIQKSISLVLCRTLIGIVYHQHTRVITLLHCPLLHGPLLHAAWHGSRRLLHSDGTGSSNTNRCSKLCGPGLLDDALHLRLAAQVQLHGRSVDGGVVAHHALTSVLVRAESDEGVAPISADDVYATCRDGQPLEEVSDVERAGRPGQALEADDD